MRNVFCALMGKAGLNGIRQITLDGLNLVIVLRIFIVVIVFRWGSFLRDGGRACYFCWRDSWGRRD
jgi:hypothetical protein